MICAFYALLYHMIYMILYKTEQTVRIICYDMVIGIPDCKDPSVNID